MNQVALEPRGEIPASHWVKRAIAVTLCLGLVVALGAAFTRVIAARVPEQRATLEKLITERTGLNVRFENVRFAWNLDGTSAVFTRVELTDPKAGRVRVVAPELRVELDAWDFLRHQQFSLGHVTLSSPDIEITSAPARVAGAASGESATPPAADERARVRDYLSWAELMPNGRVEVEAARVHLKRHGERTAHRTFTLSQAVISRGGGAFTAHGTMMLAQDVGQSLFVSATLQGLGSATGAGGELRVIARRVFLDKLAFRGLEGRGTIDARLRLRDGLVDSGNWQASARELRIAASGTRFDHVALNGALRRAAGDVFIDVTDLQLTRDARLERAPLLSAKLEIAPDGVHVTRTTIEAARLPFMAAEFAAGVVTPRLARAPPAMAAGWAARAGELLDVQFDSGAPGPEADGWQFAAAVRGAELARESDGARLSGVAARLRASARSLQLELDAAAVLGLHLPQAEAPRELALAGRLERLDGSRWRFEGFTVSSGSASLSAEGAWDASTRGAQPLVLTLRALDRPLLDDVVSLAALDIPAALAQAGQGTISTGSLRLVPLGDASGIDWQRSSGKLELEDLALVGEAMPALQAGRGALDFARGAAQLRIVAGRVDELEIKGGRIDWPRNAAPRLRATLAGELDAPAIREALREHGLERLAGKVTLEAEARGEKELHEPQSWRVTAQVSDASLQIASGLPPLEALEGSVRYSGRQLRGLTLNGQWLGGHVELESRRAAARPGLVLAANGVAEAAPLLELLGRAEAGTRLTGRVSWNGTAQRLAGRGDWQVTLHGDLAGLESNLPDPFAKPRNRSLPLAAELSIDGSGVRDFSLESGTDISLRGQVRGGATSAHFELRGVRGDLRRVTGDSLTQINVARMELARLPSALAFAVAMVPEQDQVTFNITELRAGNRALGGIRAHATRRETALQFALESTPESLHQLAAQGSCGEADARCRVRFEADTRHLAVLLQGVRLPAEWPLESLRASGEMSWPVEIDGAVAPALAGSFQLETQGADSLHQASAQASLADGQILLTQVQGSGPATDEVFRGTGRIGVVAHDYDLTLDYEKVALAGTPVPTRFARALSALRGTAARRGLAEAPDARRVQWRGDWD
jgi:hypothetical protein